MSLLPPGSGTSGRSGPRSAQAETESRPVLTRTGAIVDCAVYREGHRQPDPGSYADAVRDARRRGGFVWIGLYEPTLRELGGIAEEFGLHPLAVEDAIHAHQRPKMERYDGLLFVVFKTARYCPHDQITSTSEIIETGEVMVFCGADFAITVRHGPHGGLADVRHRLEAEPELLRHGPAAVLYAVADHIVDDYLDVANALRVDIDEIEELVFASQRRNDIERIYQLKREMLQFKRAVVPLQAPMRMLAESGSVIPPELRQYFRDVEDHLIRVSDQFAGYDELLTTVLQASLAQTQVAMNEDMRRISGWVAIIAVPTMIAGIYGMNFDHMPELRWVFGYPLVLVVMVGICVLLYKGFKRSGWL